MNRNLVPDCHSCEKVSESEIECPAPTCSYDIGGQWSFDLFDEDSIFGRYLERSCRVLIKKLGKCVGYWLVQAEDID